MPLSRTRRQCTVMLDTGRSPRDARGLNAIHQRELERSAELRARLRGATQVTSAWTCDATVYDSAQPASEHVLLVGDAASFIEPLSSAGVKKALLSAWRAAVVANTCLRNESLAGAARDLYNRRERHVYDDCMQRSRAFFAEATASYGTAFWSARAAAATDAAQMFDDAEAMGSELSDAALARDPEVRSAFDHLRAGATFNRPVARHPRAAALGHAAGGRDRARDECGRSAADRSRAGRGPRPLPACGRRRP